MLFHSYHFQHSFRHILRAVSVVLLMFPFRKLSYSFFAASLIAAEELGD